MQHIRGFVESSLSPIQNIQTGSSTDLQKDGTVSSNLKPSDNKEINYKSDSSLKNSGSKTGSNFIPSPELGDIMFVLLDQLDISWLNPDKSVTLEILQIISTFVESFSNISTFDVTFSNSSSSRQLAPTSELKQGEVPNIFKP